MIRFALLALLVASAARAETPDEAAPILDAARQECRAEAGDTAGLIVEPGAFTWVALDEPDMKDDLIVDFNHVLCSLNFSLWHGTGGSRIHVVLNGGTTEGWSGGLWRMTEFNGWPLMLIGRHGSACDGYGAQPCVQAIAAQDGQFSTIRFPDPLDSMEGGD